MSLDQVTSSGFQIGGRAAPQIRLSPPELKDVRIAVSVCVKRGPQGYSSQISRPAKIRLANLSFTRFFARERDLEFRKEPTQTSTPSTDSTIEQRLAKAVGPEPMISILESKFDTLIPVFIVKGTLTDFLLKQSIDLRRHETNKVVSIDQPEISEPKNSLRDQYFFSVLVYSAVSWPVELRSQSITCKDR